MGGYGSNCQCVWRLAKLKDARTGWLRLRRSRLLQPRVAAGPDLLISPRLGGIADVVLCTGSFCAEFVGLSRSVSAVTAERRVQVGHRGPWLQQLGVRLER